MIQARIEVPINTKLTALERSIRTEMEIDRLLESLGSEALRQALQTGAVTVSGTQSSDVSDSMFVYEFKFEVEPKAEDSEHPYDRGYSDAPAIKQSGYTEDYDVRAYYSGWLAGSYDYYNGKQALDLGEVEDKVAEVLCEHCRYSRGEVFVDGMQDRAGGMNLIANPFRWQAPCKTEQELAEVWAEGWRTENETILNGANLYGPLGRARFDWSTFGSWSPEQQAYRLGYTQGYDDAAHSIYHPYTVNPYSHRNLQEIKRESWTVWNAGYDKGHGAYNRLSG